MKVNTYVEYQIATGEDALYLSIDIPNYRDSEGGRYFAKPLEWCKREQGIQVEVAPFLGSTLQNIRDNIQPSVRDFIQAIMDEGWSMGLRPLNFKDHTNELTAVRYHLEDMRGLAFKTGKPR